MHCRRGLFPLYLSTVALFACREAPPEPPLPPSPEPAPTVFLTTEDAGVTEAWLKLSIPDTVVGRTFTLIRDSQLILSSSLIASDTVLIDEGLTPNHLYSYRAYRVSDSTVVDSTEALPVTTMDTTSHAFVFEIDTLGGASSSVLLDVAIIDENNIWAVGEMYLLDSMGQYENYNLAKWDGVTWNLLRVEFPVCDINGNEIGTAVHMTYAALAFAPTDIWMTDGGNIAHWNGLVFQRFCLPPGLIDGALLKLWGRSNSDFYGVGRQGTIVHYDGTTWQRIESGTTLPIQDIWGGTDQITGEETVLAVASNKYQNEGKKLLRIEGTTVSEVSDSGLGWSLSGLWFSPNRRFYVVGAGIYQKRSLSDALGWELYPSGVVTSYYTHGIHGQGLNDVVAAGGFGEVVHFNGVSWANYYGTTHLTAGNYYRVQIQGNTMVAVGQDFSQAVVLRGWR